ncbi:cell adhesion molecule CEACAM1-like isoform X2 [Pseudochaenichthys georgianus]|uniref:cell adhesion molecule CEACAM1-like isoform X2 n=1 Tax=Pseudochaenichthys georgianus TaxID=52239 RepID=UPI0039C1FF8A
MDIFALLWIVSLAFTGVTDGAGVLPDRLNAAVGGKVMFNTTLTPGTTFQSVNWKFGNEDIFTWNVNNFPAPEYEDRITFIMSTGSLELRNLALTDSGDYTVTILLPGEPPQSGSTRLEVYAPVSNVKVTSSSTELVEFSSVSLSCSSSGSPLSFLWLNSSSEVTGSDRVQITDGNSTLTVTNVTRYDQGPFRCRVSNPVSEGTSDPVTLTIYSPVSKVTVTSSSTELVEFNSSVSLSCSSSGSSLSFLWLNSSSEVTGSDRVQITDGGSTLTITNVTRYDQGPFSCHVSNPVSNGTSKAVTLIIYHGPENINLKISPPHKPYLEGSNISLSCSAVSNPSAHYTWFLNGGLLSKGSQFNLINSQKNQSGSYSCQAFNDKTLRYEISHPASISVLEKVSGASVTSPSNRPIEGNSFRLICDAAGSVFTREWRKGGLDLTLTVNMTLTTNKRELSFSSLSKDHTGGYSCIISNPLSSEEAKYSMIVNYGPETVQITGPSQIHVGGTFKLTCSAASVPTANYTWTLNGTVKHNSAVFYKNNSELSDSGNYFCEAINDITGRKSSAVHELTVTHEPGPVQSGCSGGCIAGIVIGVLVVLGVVAAIVWYFLWYKKKQKKERSAGNTNTRTGVEGQDNGAYTRSQEMHYADVRFTKKNNGETVQMGDQNKPSDYAEVRVNNNPRAAASSLPTYDAHLQRNKRPAPQPEITEIYAQVRKN